MRLRWLFSLMIAVHFANSASSRCSDIAVFLHEHAKGTGDQIWAYVVVRPYSASQILVGLRWFQTIGNADIYAMWSESTHRKGNVTVTDEESWPITGFENTQVLIPIKAESHQFSISMNSSLGYTTFFNYSFVQGMPQINMPNQLCIHETKQNYDACLCCEHEPPSSFCPNVIADEPMACQQFQNTLSLNSLSGFFYGAYRFDRTGYFGTQDMDILHNDPLSLLFFTTVFFNGNQVNPTAFGCKNNCWYALPSDSLTSVLHIRVQVSFIGIIFKHTAAEFYLNQKGDVFRNGRMKYSDMYTPQNPCYTSDKRCLCCYHFLMDTQCYDPSSPLPTPPIEYSSTVLMTSATKTTTTISTTTSERPTSTLKLTTTSLSTSSSLSTTTVSPTTTSTTRTSTSRTSTAATTKPLTTSASRTTTTTTTTRKPTTTLTTTTTTREPTTTSSTHPPPTTTTSTTPPTTVSTTTRATTTSTTPTTTKSPTTTTIATTTSTVPPTTTSSTTLRLTTTSTSTTITSTIRPTTTISTETSTITSIAPTTTTMKPKITSTTTTTTTTREPTTTTTTNPPPTTTFSTTPVISTSTAIISITTTATSTTKPITATERPSTTSTAPILPTTTSTTTMAATTTVSPMTTTISTIFTSTPVISTLPATISSTTTAPMTSTTHEPTTTTTIKSPTTTTTTSLATTPSTIASTTVPTSPALTTTTTLPTTTQPDTTSAPTSTSITATHSSSTVEPTSKTTPTMSSTTVKPTIVPTTLLQQTTTSTISTISTSILSTAATPKPTTTAEPTSTALSSTASSTTTGAMTTTTATESTTTKTTKALTTTRPNTSTTPTTVFTTTTVEPTTTPTAATTASSSSTLTTSNAASSITPLTGTSSTLSTLTTSPSTTSSASTTKMPRLSSTFTSMSISTKTSTTLRTTKETSSKENTAALSSTQYSPRTPSSSQEPSTTSKPTEFISSTSSSSITGSTTPMSSSIQTTTEMLTTTTVLTTTTESQSCLSSPSCSGLYNISHTPVTPHTIHRIIRNVTANIKHRSVNLTGDDIYYISIIVSRIASSGPLTDKVFDDVSTVIDLTLEAQKEQFDDSDEQQRGSTERILDSIDIMMKNSNGTVKYLTGNNFALAARNPDCSGLTKNDDGLADYLTRFDYVSRDVQKSTDPSASITIPLSTICSANVDRVYYAIYRNTKLFVPAGEVSKRKKRSASPEEAVTPPPKNRCKHGKFMNDGRVLTATALKKSAESFEKLSMYNDATTQSEATMAILSYSDKDKLQPLHGKFAVSWWKDSSYWSSDLCNVETTSHGYEAHCTHLTDFTLIVDGLLTEPCLCDNNLVILGYAMGSFSLLGLLFLGVLYCSNYSKLLRDMDLIRKLRGNPSATANDAVSVLYIFTMLLFYLSFTFFSDKAIAGSACNTLAGVNYWLLLSCLTFTMCQSLRTLRVFAWSKIMEKVLYFMTRDYIVIGLSYGVSSIVVITFATTITNFFKREDDYCWIRPDWVIVSVVVPLSILVICGIVCFALIIMRLFPNIFKRYSSRGSSRALHRTKNYLKRKIVAILLMQFSLGIPWVFQYLTLFSPQVTVWHYLFTIVNGSQGVTLFLLYLYRRILLQRQKRQSKKLTSSYASSKSREQRQRAHSEFYQHFD